MCEGRADSRGVHVCIPLCDCHTKAYTPRFKPFCTCLAQIIKVFFGFLGWIVRHGLRPADRTRRGCGAHRSWCVRVAQKQARHTGGRYNAAF